MIPEYPWLELVGVRVPADGEAAILTDGSVVLAFEFVGVHVIVKPNNVYDVLRLEDLKIPEGYEPDGESLKDAFRVPADGGIYLPYTDTEAWKWDGYCKGDARRLCLRKIAPKTISVLTIEWYNPPTDILKAWLVDTSDIPGRSVRVEERPI